MVKNEFAKNYSHYLYELAYATFKISGERIAERVIEAVIINICTMTIRDMIRDLKEKKKAEAY